MPKGLTFLATLLLLASLAPADVIVDLVDGSDDSGWSVAIPDDVDNGIVVDRVTYGQVRIEIAKNFSDPMENAECPPRTFLFTQRLPDAQTVATIVIDDEIIRNLTGSDWTDFHWEIVGAAAFDKSATDSSGFSIAPFTVKTWGPAQAGWDANHPSKLDVAGGVVPPGGTFVPGLDSGRLYIDVALGLENSDFTLMQVPTPEPAAAVLILIGSGLALKRRRRARR